MRSRVENEQEGGEVQGRVRRFEWKTEEGPGGGHDHSILIDSWAEA